MERAGIIETAAAGRELDAATARAVRAFLDRLQTAPLDLLVYGSRARGCSEPDSDIDVAVILDGPRGDRYGALLALADVAYDVLLETGLRIQALPLWRADFERPGSFANPALLDAVRRDGLRP